MHSSFSVTQENLFDRHFGGTVKGVADPYISGYSFIKFKRLPEQLPNIIQNDIADLGIGSEQQISDILSSSCIAVTPPGGTLNRAEFVGLGGSKWSVPTNMDYGNTITLRFYEYSRLPILQIFHSWFRLIREYRTGTTPLLGSSAAGATDTYTKRAYSGTLLYWTTKPDGKTVEYSACYSGVFPTVDPQNLYPGDLTAVDKLEVDIELSLDWIWKESWVREEAQFWADFYHASGISTHGIAAPGGTNNSVGTHTANNSNPG